MSCSVHMTVDSLVIAWVKIRLLYLLHIITRRSATKSLVVRKFFSFFTTGEVFARDTLISLSA